MNYTLDALTIGYGGRAICPPLSATLRQGELCCLLGPNGAGKSTLLRTLAAFQPPLGGRRMLDGTDPEQCTPAQLGRLVGVVLTERTDAQGLTVKQLVALGRSPHTNFWGRLTAADHEAVAHALDLTGIAPLSQRRVSTLSDGERQKALIAKALAQETPVILLDEPTAFLDFPSKADTLLLLRRLCREMQKTILLSTHDLDLALQTADRLWFLAQGRPIVTGTPHQLAADGTLARFFQSKHTRFDARELRFRIL